MKAPSPSIPRGTERALRRSGLELRPGGVVLRRGDHRLDERHAADAVLDLGEVQGGIAGRQLALLEARADGSGEVAVDVGERLEVALGMGGRGSRGGGGSVSRGSRRRFPWRTTREK